MSRIRTVLILALSLFFIVTQANNIRQISSKDGLSNSAILSMYQANNGAMWLGTCDGINLFDGLKAEIYSSFDKSRNLSGNIIENIIEENNDILWIRTNYGLDRFNKKTKTLKSFKEFTGKYFISKGKDNTIFIIKSNNKVFYYNERSQKFEIIRMEDLVYENLLRFKIDRNNKFWLFTKDGVSRTYSIIKKENNELGLEFSNRNESENKALSCLEDGNTIFLIDELFNLYNFNLEKNEKTYIHNLANNILQNGEITSLVEYAGEYYIGYKTNGLYRLRSKQGILEDEPEKLNIQSGIFCILKDKYQDVLWIGSDGQGVFMYYKDKHSIQSRTSKNIFNQIEKPIRALFIDRENTLWIGTKGDGIIKIQNYDNDKSDIEKKNISYIKAGSSSWRSNSVYSFAASRHNILWSGREDGLTYYSYKDRQIHKIGLKSKDNQDVEYIHSIIEHNDSTLWISTVGNGVFRISLRWSSDTPIVKSVDKFFFNEDMSHNFFFTAYREDSTSVWFGNRGYGVFHAKEKENKLTQLLIDKKGDNQLLNDIYCIKKDRRGNMWFGTSTGLVKYDINTSSPIKVFDTNNGFPNNMIHGMLEDTQNNLWLSTNRGIIKFNTINETFRVYNETTGLDIIEFSDGAFFKDKLRNTLYFGGVNGFITIEESKSVSQEYIPHIQLNKLSIFGEDCNIYDYISGDSNTESLNLKYYQNFFTISFSAIDYINGNNFSFLYKIDKVNDTWVNNGNLNSISFTNIAPGEYNLQIKYRNNTTGRDGDLYTLLLKISPPWYQSAIAYFVYTFIFLILLALFVRSIIIRNNRKKNKMVEKLKQKHKEEVYESKFKFFTSIAHEFCTPLTLIYGPCNRILTHKESDPFVIKYTELIQRNAERLNSLIQDLIEFRRIETGNRPPRIESMRVDVLINNIVSTFSDLEESRNIKIERSIQSPLEWNTDKQFLEIIISNLLSNAFKYSTLGYTIKINVEIVEDKLQIIISNKGKGLLGEDIKQIFDRYTILDNFEHQDTNHIFSRNGLGLAITYSMTAQLEGHIDVQSTPNEWTNFSVTLPMLASSGNNKHPQFLPPLEMRKDYESPIKLPDYAFDQSKSTIFIIDDDVEILWLISEIFADTYNVIPKNSSVEAKKELETIHPDIILCDIMMPDIDGITLVKEIKANKKTAHIPIILISAKHSIEEQIEGIDAGAEVYLTKPFNVEYLKKIIKRFIVQKELLKDYLSSPLSAFDFVDGKMTHKENTQFVQKILDIINKNITNRDLSAKFIANELSLSPRQLYRKIGEITDQSPLDMIRESKLHIAQNLLVTTKMTVDEITYKSGFQTKSSFFKTFATKFKCTPKEYREREKKERMEDE